MVGDESCDKDNRSRRKSMKQSPCPMDNHSLDGEQTEVRLTKFKPLQPNLRIFMQPDGESIEQDFNNLKSLSAANLLYHQHQQQQDNINGFEDNHNRKWPWYGGSSSKGKIVTRDGQKFHGSNSAAIPSDTATTEPFQVVWRRLSFSVYQSTYDHLIGGALRRARTCWPLRLSGDGSSEETTTGGAECGKKNGVIFENLNGYVRSGEISAILGPSGSGKTSLLNAICGRVKNYRGSVQLLGGGKRRMRLSIIPQKDYLIENLTVRENLLFSSQILNTSEHFNHDANIMRVVKMLNLTSCLHSNAANISGGEYKRVSIAQELLRQPDILILDEPTSGLDSLNCKNLIKSLVRLIEASRRGTIKPIAIVMTIHQPDVDLFQMFDHVYCMARHGRVIFDGHPSDAMDRIRDSSGLSLDDICPSKSSSMEGGGGVSLATNPANLLIEIASEDLYGQEPIDRLACIQRELFERHYQSISKRHSRGSSDCQGADFQQLNITTSDNYLKGLYYGGSQLLAIADGHRRVHKPMMNELVTQSPPSVRSSISNLSSNTKESHLVRDKRLSAKTNHSGQFWHHTGILTRRAFLSAIRDPLMTVSSLLFHLAIPFVMWTVYSKRTGSVGACPVIQREMDMISMVSNNTMSKMQEMQEELTLALECSTMFFLSTYSFSMCSLSIAALAFPLNMHILLKEVRNGWYNLPSYVVAKTIATFPFEVLFPVISLVMIYLLLGMPGSYLSWRLWAIALVMALISMISHTQGLIFGAICMNSVQTAIFLSSAATLPQTLLSGFTARIKHMPMVLQKLSWLSLYRYSSDSINIIRFGYGICPCDMSTDEYLRAMEPSFTDIPPQMKPLFTYYLTNTAPTDSITAGGLSETISNGTYLTNSTMGSMLASNVSQMMTEYVPQIPGITYDLTLNSTARNLMIKKIENNELDLFGRMAGMMARSFSYGRAVDNCDTVRSELLATAGALKDDYLPLLFAGMFGLLVSVKLILFIIVKLKIGSLI